MMDKDTTPTPILPPGAKYRGAVVEVCLNQSNHRRIHLSLCGFMIDLVFQYTMRQWVADTPA